MAKAHSIRDPVHNFVRLRDKEIRLVNAPVFQRLRGIRQLALANLVYPGAIHTRFDHSLGVCHVAGLMADELDLPTDQVELVRLAALLHDLGHGPFSHVSEISLEQFADRSKLPADQKKEKIHELITARLIQTDPAIVRELGEATCQRVVRLLAEGHGPPALRSLVSGPLDADKQDYLLRDSRFCGVTYGVFDIHQLHRSLVLAGSPEERELRIAAEGVSAVEQFVLAKYYMTLNVYRHRVRLITDQMIARAIVLGIEQDGIEEIRRLYRFDNSDAFFANYLAWDDPRFLHSFSADAFKEKVCGQMVRRLNERRLLKLVFSEHISLFPEHVREPLLALGQVPNQQDRQKLEQALANVIEKQIQSAINPNFVIVHAFDIKSVRVMSRNDEAGILVDRPGKPRSFEDESSLFRSIDQGYSDGFVEVYAPTTWETPTDRKRIKNQLFEPIRTTIDSFWPKVQEKETAK
jgi:HD superfamily phosphohydrolase